MKRRLVLAAVCTAFLLGQSFAHGQRETERFIPIGQSPGASGKTTRIGTVQEASANARMFLLAEAGRAVSVQVPPGTPIWLDRSGRKKSALAGAIGDLRPGRRVEVCYEDAARTGRVRWIKVEVAH